MWMLYFWGIHFYSCSLSLQSRIHPNFLIVYNMKMKITIFFFTNTMTIVSNIVNFQLSPNVSGENLNHIGFCARSDEVGENSILAEEFSQSEITCLKITLNSKNFFFKERRKVFLGWWVWLRIWIPYFIELGQELLL